MKTIDEIRYGNLDSLIKAAAGPGGDIGKGLSKLVAEAEGRGKKLSRPTLYQIHTRKETAAGTVKNIGDELARNIEDALKLEEGWMDNRHDQQVMTKDEIAIVPNEIADMVMTYCQSDETNRRGIMAAIEQAKAANLAATTANNQPKRWI